jgi:hypothetical protein
MTNGVTSGREAESGGDGVGLQADGAWVAAAAAVERGRRSTGAPAVASGNVVWSGTG